MTSQVVFAPRAILDALRYLLLKEDPRSTFRNNFLQPATNVFVARQVHHAGVKMGSMDQNLQGNNVARQVEDFCISHFAALRRIILVIWRCL